jgi:hypothetical protein
MFDVRWTLPRHNHLPWEVRVHHRLLQWPELPRQEGDVGAAFMG